MLIAIELFRFVQRQGQFFCVQQARQPGAQRHRTGQDPYYFSSVCHIILQIYQFLARMSGLRYRPNCLVIENPTTASASTTR